MFSCHPKSSAMGKPALCTAEAIPWHRWDPMCQDAPAPCQVPLGALRHTRAARLKAAFRLSTRQPGGWEASEHAGFSPARALALSCGDAIT